MPEMNGRDLARQLLAGQPEIRVLFMSGYAANILTHQGVLDEGVDFIEKRFAI
jgi:two-component system, cell cycle sensor histidine kinase and response regulator CckA